MQGDFTLAEDFLPASCNNGPQHIFTISDNNNSFVALACVLKQGFKG